MTMCATSKHDVEHNIRITVTASYADLPPSVVSEALSDGINHAIKNLTSKIHKGVTEAYLHAKNLSEKGVM